MRVLEITGEPILHGGQEAFIYNILENISNPDLCIDVLTPYHCNNNKFRNLIRSKNGSVYELNLDFRPWKSRRLIYKPVKDFFREHPYDVVHIHSGSISVLAYESLAARKAGAKKILVHSHSTGVRNLKHTLIHTAFSPLLLACPTDYLACSSQAGEMKFPKAVQKRVRVIPNGIKLEKFKRNEEKRSELRKEYGLSQDSFVIGHVGRFTAEKNHRFLVDVLQRMLKDDGSCYLLLVGEGVLFEEVRQLVNEKKLSERVVFTGVVDNPEDYYNMMDYFVLPSIYEGFSLVTLEAQANGLPCLVSTGVPDAAVLTDSVKKMELDPEMWADYLIEHRGVSVRNNRELLAEKGYDIVEAAREIEELYLN